MKKVGEKPCNPVLSSEMSCVLWEGLTGEAQNKVDKEVYALLIQVLEESFGRPGTPKSLKWRPAVKWIGDALSEYFENDAYLSNRPIQNSIKSLEPVLRQWLSVTGALSDELEKCLSESPFFLADDDGVVRAAATNFYDVLSQARNVGFSQLKVVQTLPLKPNSSPKRVGRKPLDVQANKMIGLIIAAENWIELCKPSLIKGIAPLVSFKTGTSNSRGWKLNRINLTLLFLAAVGNNEYLEDTLAGYWEKLEVELEEIRRVERED